MYPLHTKCICDAMSFLFSKCQNRDLAVNIRTDLYNCTNDYVADNFWALANKNFNSDTDEPIFLTSEDITLSIYNAMAFLSNRKTIELEKEYLEAACIEADLFLYVGPEVADHFGYLASHLVY